MRRRDFLVRSALTGASLPLLAACGSDTAEEGARLSDLVMPPNQPLPAPAVQAALVMAGRAFEHGVASGDPTESSLILWTALTPAVATVTVIPVWLEYVLTQDRAEDPALWPEQVAAAELQTLGPFQALAVRDFTLKVDLGNTDAYEGTEFMTGKLIPLPADNTVLYRFRAGDQVSRWGRARTLSGNPERARFATTSCANMPSGLFSVYDMIRQQPELDFVVHLGDYIYEYGPGEYGDAPKLPERRPQPPREMVTRADYRQRHAQYKRDPELQRLHAQLPMVAVWDDHEITNDAWSGGAENHQPVEGFYAVRRDIAVTTYFNWMPLREQFARLGPDAMPDPREVIYRRIRVGQLMDLILLDTRLIGRDQQLPDAAQPERFNSARSLLGPMQRAWLQLQLVEAKHANQAWTFLGQQVMFAPLNLLGLPQLIPALPEGFAINADQWDGYVAERCRVRAGIESIDLTNVVVLTGDIHTSWASELYENPTPLLDPLLTNLSALTGGFTRALPLTEAETPYGVELVCPSVTSPGLPDEVNPLLEAAIPLLNPHMKYVELRSRGFVLVEVTRERLRAEWRYAASITDPSLMGVENEAKRVAFEVDSVTARLRRVVPYLNQS